MALLVLLLRLPPCIQVIDSMAPGSSKVLEQVLKLIDAYDLYGR